MEQKLIRKRQDEFEAEGKEYAAYYDNEETILEERSKVPYLHFGSFDRQEWLQLSFSTRLGGVSDGYLSSLNLGWDRGEDGKMSVRITAVTARASERIIKSLCCRIRCMRQR